MEYNEKRIKELAFSLNEWVGEKETHYSQNEISTALTLTCSHLLALNKTGSPIEETLIKEIYKDMEENTFKAIKDLALANK